MGRRGGRLKQLLDDLKEERGQWKLKKEAVDCALCWTRCVRGYRRVVRQTTKRMTSIAHQKITSSRLAFGVSSTLHY
jgi:hypothetical protein